jgi:hypothetical protein
VPTAAPPRASSKTGLIIAGVACLVAFLFIAARAGRLPSQPHPRPTPTTSIAGAVVPKPSVVPDHQPSTKPQTGGRDNALVYYVSILVSLEPRVGDEKPHLLLAMGARTEQRNLARGYINDPVALYPGEPLVVSLTQINRMAAFEVGCSIRKLRPDGVIVRVDPPDRDWRILSGGGSILCETVAEA